MNTASPKRRGRSARAQKRATTIPKVVVPGMTGGSYRPLQTGDLPKIHQAALKVLEETGIGGVIPRYRELFKAAGCWVNDHGRVCFPPALVEDCIAMAAKKVTVFGQNPDQSIEFGANKVHFATGSTAVFVSDSQTGEVRPSTLQDVYDATRVADAMLNIHCCTRQLMARDIKSIEDLDINTAYAIASGTTKPFGAGVTDAANTSKVADMMDVILGSEGQFKKTPICWSGGAFTVSPLRAPEDGQDKLEAAIHAGFPLHQVMVPQSGTTGPASLAGTLVQCTAESLFVLCFVNIMKPGHPLVVGCWPYTSDLRTGAFSGGGGEQALLMAASAQLFSYYGLPQSNASGMSDSKLPDAQAGYEKGITTTLAACSGATMIYTYTGNLGSIMTLSYEQMIIDDEIIGIGARTLRGIEVTDETLAVSVVGEAAVDPGHFIAHEQTMDLMETEYFYPSVGDRSSLNDWLQATPPTIEERARSRSREILDTHFPSHISEATDQKIRSNFNILLPRDRMTGKA